MANHTIYKKLQYCNRKTGSNVRFGVLILLLLSSLTACSLLPIPDITDVLGSNDNQSTSVDVEASIDGHKEGDGDIEKTKDQFKSDSRIKNDSGFVHKAGNNYYHLIVSAQSPTEQLHVNLDLGQPELDPTVLYLKYICITSGAILVFILFVLIFVRLRKK